MDWWWPNIQAAIQGTYISRPRLYSHVQPPPLTIPGQLLIPMHTEISDRKPSTALMDTAEYNLRLQVPYSTSTNGSRQTVPIIPPPRPVRERPAQTSKTLPLSFQSLASVTSVLRHPTTMYMYACYGFLAPAGM